ncbi:MAG: hypothetical protein QE487_19530 [Fluviicola sp.]|nr:hypothetical protein [Fluviicola sp.]
MKQRSLLLFIHLIALAAFAQRPDSVQVNGQWYFVYPLQEKLKPGVGLLDKLDLSETQFELFKEWKLANDPRLKLSKRILIDSLNRELIRTKITVSKEQNKYEWRDATRPEKMIRPLLMRKKYWYRNNPELLTNQAIDLNYDLVPAVQNLPNGKYIQYFEPMLSYHEMKKTTVLPTKVAAIFELKNNLLEHEFTRFNCNGDTIRHGFFTDGLKEGLWTISDKGTYLSSGIHGLSEENTIYYYGSSIRVELEKGILNGSFSKWDSYDSHQQVGYFKNGYADSIWNLNSAYSWRNHEIFDYNSVVDSNYDQRLAIEIMPTIILERKYEEFDFKEKKNDYHSLTLYECQEEMYEQGQPARPVVNFADLFDKPMQSGLTRLKMVTSGYHSNYRNTGHVNFHGTKQVFEGKRLAERYTYLPDFGAIVYARFFKNGAVFDTLGFDPRDSLFVHNVFDANGKLFRTTTYNTDGEHVQQIDYYKRKETKIRYQKPVMIEGFETERSYSSGKKSREWEGDRIVDGKRYMNIEWLARTKKRTREEFENLSDLSLHELIYNHNGEVVVEHTRFLVTVDSLGDQNQVEYGKRDIVNSGNVKLTQETIKDVKLPIVLTNFNQPYSGKMNIRFSENALKLEDQALDGLDWTIPWDETSRSLHKQFVELYASNDYPQSISYDSYYLDEKDYGNLFSRLMEELFHNQFGLYLIARMEGEFQNGQPSGNWNYYDKKGIVVFTLNFVNGLPNGDVTAYARYNKPERRDRKRNKDEPYFDFLFSKDAPKTYVERTYHFVDGKLNGPLVVYTAMGDTLEFTEYKMGQLHGKMWQRIYDNVYQYEFQNDALHGSMYSGSLGYNDKKEIVMDTLNYAHYENGLLNGDCYLEFYESDYDDENYGNEERIQVSHYRYIQIKKTVRCHFQQGLLHGNYVQRKESGETEYTLSLSNGMINTLTFFENGAPSYYYDYTEEQRLLPFHLTDTTALNLQTRFFYHPNLSFLEYNVSEDDQMRYGRMGEPYSRSMTIEDYKQGRFTKLYPNGNIARRGYRIGDKSWGDWDFYNYDGQRLYSIDYGTQTVVMHGVTYSESEIKGEYIEYDSLGNEICKGYVIEELEKYDCAHSDYYAIRQFILLEDRQDSYERTNGLMKYYFDNGMLMSEGTLKNGMPEGVWKFYTPDGKLTRIGKYVNGKKEGRWLKGDLGDKKYIGEICLNPDDPLLDFHIAELERMRDVEIVIYKNGLAQILQQYEVTD